jgi:hypothetical protein
MPYTSIAENNRIEHILCNLNRVYLKGQPAPDAPQDIHVSVPLYCVVGRDLPPFRAVNGVNDIETDYFHLYLYGYHSMFQ